VEVFIDQGAEGNRSVLVPPAARVISVCNWEQPLPLELADLTDGQALLLWIRPYDDHDIIPSVVSENKPPTF
jgi:hypothetical protein